MAEQNATLVGHVVPEAALEGRVNMPQFVGGGGSDVPIMSETVAGIAKIGENLKIDEAGHLSVDTADEVTEDDNRPVTAAAVFAAVARELILVDRVTGKKYVLFVSDGVVGIEEYGEDSAVIGVAIVGLAVMGKGGN